VIIPEGNRGDFEGLPEVVKSGIKIHLVENFSDVVKIAFEQDE
jgi:ATP-dependent Lon protease